MKKARIVIEQTSWDSWSLKVSVRFLRYFYLPVVWIYYRGGKGDMDREVSWYQKKYNCEVINK